LLVLRPVYTRRKCTTQKDLEEQALSPARAEVRVLDPEVAVVGSPQGVEAGDDHLIEGEWEEPNSINVRFQS
jgi:hypothetical protein